MSKLINDLYTKCKNTITEIQDKIVLYEVNNKRSVNYNERINERLNELKNYEKLTDVVELKNVFVELQSILKSLMFNNQSVEDESFIEDTYETQSTNSQYTRLQSIVPIVDAAAKAAAEAKAA